MKFDFKKTNLLKAKSLKKIFSFIEKIFGRIFVFAIRFYKAALSPLFPPCCRFYPTCSNYALQAFQKYAFPKAVFLSCKRLSKCNKFFAGGYDPVP